MCWSSEALTRSEAYESYLEPSLAWRHRISRRVCGCFWIDVSLDLITFGLYAAATLALTYLLP